LQNTQPLSAESLSSLEGLEISLPPEVPARALETAKILSQKYSHMRRVVEGPTPYHARSSRRGFSLEKTEPSALQLSHVLRNVFSLAPSISIAGVVDCYEREVEASRFAGNLELRGFNGFQVKGSVIKQNKGAPNEIHASFEGQGGYTLLSAMAETER